MVIIRPSICAIREATVSEMVYDAFIRVLLRAHEDQASGQPQKRGYGKCIKQLTVLRCEDNRYH